MKNMIRKDFSLAVMPYNYIFLLFGAMLMIPDYPLYVAFFYATLSLYLMFKTGNENGDVMFTALLPVRKCDIVRGRCATVAILELAQVLLSVPFAVLRMVLYKGSPIENSLFTEPNVAFFGITLVMLAIFNALFLPRFYKDGRTVKFLVPCIVTFVFILFAECFAIVPQTAKYIDAIDKASQIKQLPVLLGGMAVYAGGMLLTCRRCEKLFEKVDL